MHVLTIDYNNGWQCKQAWKQLKASNNAMEARENKLEERRGGSRKWKKSRISLAFEHRFVIIGRI